MTNIVKIRRSSVPGRIPSSLESGELAVNTADRKLYFGTGTEVIELTARERYNVPTTVEQNGSSINVVSSKEFVAGTTRLYLGGQRQHLGVDYTEVSSTVMQLVATLTVADVADGSIISLDLQEK